MASSDVVSASSIPMLSWWSMRFVLLNGGLPASLATSNKYHMTWANSHNNALGIGLLDRPASGIET